MAFFFRVKLILGEEITYLIMPISYPKRKPPTPAEKAINQLYNFIGALCLITMKEAEGVSPTSWLHVQISRVWRLLFFFFYDFFFHEFPF